MTTEERKVEIFDLTDRAITNLRIIRNRVQKGKHIDPSEFTELMGGLSSLRHHCEMHNDERIVR